MYEKQYIIEKKIKLLTSKKNFKQYILKNQKD